MSDKLHEIEMILAGGRGDAKRLIALSLDEDAEVRFRAIESFEKFVPTNIILDRVRKGIFDSDELVRCTCIELLGDWDDTVSRENLQKAMFDKNDIVRSAAITSLGQMSGNGSVDFLIEKFSSMQGTEKASAAMALYSLGQEQYLNELLVLLNDDNYRTRCAVANLSSRFIHDKDRSIVILKIKEALSREKTIAAASSFKDAIVDLE